MLTYSSLPNVQFNYLGNTQTDHSADILDGLGLLAVVLRGERWVTRGGGGGCPAVCGDSGEFGCFLAAWFLPAFPTH